MTVFEQVEKLLSDKRKYLVGERLSAADITFASLAAPLVLPRGYVMNKIEAQSEAGYRNPRPANRDNQY